MSKHVWWCMCTAGEDSVSTKLRLGGRRTVIGYTRGTTFEAATNLPAKGHVRQMVVVHLFYNLREVDGGKFSINTFCYSEVCRNQTIVSSNLFVPSQVKYVFHFIRASALHIYQCIVVYIKSSVQITFLFSWLFSPCCTFFLTSTCIPQE